MTRWADDYSGSKERTAALISHVPTPRGSCRASWITARQLGADLLYDVRRTPSGHTSLKVRQKGAGVLSAMRRQGVGYRRSQGRNEKKSTN
jgi:hypothetical protein